MSAVRRLGAAAAAALLAVSVLGSSPATAKDTSWGTTSLVTPQLTQQTALRVTTTTPDARPPVHRPTDTSWGGN